MLFLGRKGTKNLRFSIFDFEFTRQSRAFWVLSSPWFFTRTISPLDSHPAEQYSGARGANSIAQFRNEVRWIDLCLFAKLTLLLKLKEICLPL
jgi:hypothetical protein